MLLDFTNEDDFNMAWFKGMIEINILQMWSPNFKLNEDIPIVRVWVLLPGIPFHLHTCLLVKQIFSNAATPLTIDAATFGSTRPSMAKIRVEVDLLKNLPDYVYVGLEHESPLKGYNQKIEYENIPKFCMQCKKLCHNILNCRALENIRDTDSKDAGKTNKEYGCYAD